MSAPLRIAIHLPSFLPKFSGAEIFHHNLAVEFVRGGHQVGFVIPRSFARRLRESRLDLPYDIVEYPANLWGWIRRSRPLGLWLNRRALSRLQRRHAFSVWHTAFFMPSGICFADWQVHSGVPGLVRAVGDDALTAPGLDTGPLPRSWILKTIARAQCVVALSEEMKAVLVSSGISGDRVEIFPNAVRIERFTPAEADERRKLRARCGLVPDAMLILAVGRNHPQKDHATLLEAFRILRQSVASAHLVVAGRDARGLAPAVAQYGLEGSVTLRECSLQPSVASGCPELPPQELVELYRCADVFAMSSLLEGFSTALLEAMAAGLPIAATDAPGIRDQILNGITGLLSPVGDAQALARALQTLCNSPAERARLGASARRAAAEYSWEKLAERYISQYRKLLSQPL
jgi:glycosyltransferase involved in cell wall biosynthesis